MYLPCGICKIFQTKFYAAEHIFLSMYIMNGMWGKSFIKIRDAADLQESNSDTHELSYVNTLMIECYYYT